jgi:Bacterioferritin-associated ferredoxin
MFACLCSQMSTAKAKAAIAAGARTPAEIFERLHLRRNCGNCQGTLRRLIAEASPKENSPVDTPAPG